MVPALNVPQERWLTEMWLNSRRQVASGNQVDGSLHA